MPFIPDPLTYMLFNFFFGYPYIEQPDQDEHAGQDHEHLAEKPPEGGLNQLLRPSSKSTR
ncbi:MAG: hypothetical protein U5L09_13830 [Bacteroidales bacterium]|nr:hypothetical protein [Bacteroidales bacterium]